MPIKHKKQFANNCPLREGLSTHQIMFTRDLMGGKNEVRQGGDREGQPSEPLCIEDNWTVVGSMEEEKVDSKRREFQLWLKGEGRFSGIKTAALFSSNGNEGSVVKVTRQLTDNTLIQKEWTLVHKVIFKGIRLTIILRFRQTVYWTAHTTSGSSWWGKQRWVTNFEGVSSG